MKRVVNKLENSKVEVICDVETAQWKEAQEKAFKKLAKNLELKGFRKGSVPEAMARKHIDTGSIFNEAINSMLQPAFDEVLKEEKLQPFARPSVDVTKVSDSELQLKFIIVLAPEVKLGNYKGLGIKKEAVKVSEAEVKEAIDKLVAQQASLVVKDGAAEKGDTVVIDFVGSVDGKEFEGGKADNYSLELGSNSFVPGFEDQLVGHKAGENVDVNVTFPEQYVPELAGKKALFKCVVHEVKGKVTPKLDEELIKELNIPEVKDEAGLKAYEEKQLKASKEAKAQNEALNKVIDAIVKDAKIEIAEEIIAEYLSKLLGIHLYNKELVNLIAEEGNFSLDFVRKHNERLYTNGAEAFFKESYSFAENGFDSYRQLYAAQKRVIMRLAENEDCIIVGHCSNLILQNMEGALHIFIGTDMPNRVTYLSNKYNIPPKKAIEKIKKQDEDTANYYKLFTGMHWKDPDTYHICIDSAMFGDEGTADMIEYYIKKDYNSLSAVGIKDLMNHYTK